MSPVAPTRLPEQLFLTILLGTLVALVAATEWLWTWDQNIYDWQLRAADRSAPGDLIIIAVDERSLDALGQWPWSRALHAELLDRLRAAGSRAVLFDVIFAESGAADPAGDVALAGAVSAHGRVVLPVVHVDVRLGGQPMELLPYPALASVAADLGHVETQLDPDGLARSVYLQAGLGDPHWPHLAVAALRLEDPRRWNRLPGRSNPAQAASSPYFWQRDRQVWIPYLGPPGSFHRLSYVDVLRGEVPAALLRDRVLLVGATAAGMGDALPTPVSGLSHPMPGVEIVANVYDSLRRELEIVPLSSVLSVPITVVLAILPLVLYPYLAPRAALGAALGAALATLSVSVLLLHFGRLWFPPSAALLGIATSYPLWSWRRLEALVRYLDAEIEHLHGEPSGLPGAGTPSLDTAMEFVAGLLPVRSAALVSSTGRTLAAWQGSLSLPVRSRQQFSSPDSACGLVLDWSGTEAPAEAEAALLNELLKELAPYGCSRRGDTHELVQARVEQVREATARLREMRAFVTDSLAQMADGVLVVSACGRVLIANQRAAEQLGVAAAESLAGQTLASAVEPVQLGRGQSWSEALRRCLLEARGAQLESVDQYGRELLIQLAPFRGHGRLPRGVIVNLSDVTALRDSERRRRELLGFISHDLRSPLVSILALTQLMGLEGQQDERGHRIEAHARRTLDLADDLLALARVEGGEIVEAEPVDMVAVARSALDHISDEAAARHTVLTPVLGVDPVVIKGDRDLLERVLVNLVGNAVKYSPQGSQVWLRVAAEGELAVCEVRDQGSGIEQADQARVFQRFQRGSRVEHQRAPGVGLGLAFVKQVVEHHAGHISVHSQTGRGSCFRVELPRLATT